MFFTDQLLKGMKDKTAELAQSKVGKPVQYATPERGETCNDSGVKGTTLNCITAE